MSFGLLHLVGLVLLLVLASMAWTWWREFSRIRALQLKYQAEPEILADILDQVIWEGERAEQIIDSLGKPVEVQDLPRKTKRKEIWKYGHEGGNRYRLRITLDDDSVVGWELR